MRDRGKPKRMPFLLRAAVLAATGLGGVPLTGCSLGLDPSRLIGDASTAAGSEGGAPAANPEGGMTPADGGYTPGDGGTQAEGGYVPGDGGACPPCVLDESRLDECCLQ